RGGGNFVKRSVRIVRRRLMGQSRARRRQAQVTLLPPASMEQLPQIPRIVLFDSGENRFSAYIQTLMEILFAKA
ncbi:hypothetical protein ACC695_39380, partial [Rhizobium ruizarguesonis]